MRIRTASTGPSQRVLMVVPYANWAGTERHVLTLGTELKARGWDVTVLGPPGPAQEWWHDAGLKVIEFAPQVAGVRRMVSSLRQQAIAWASIVRNSDGESRRAGVIHVHGAPELLFLLQHLRRTTGFVFTSHGFAGHNVSWDYWWAAQAGRRWTDRVIAVSQEEANRLIQRGLPASRIQVIRNGIPIPADPAFTTSPPEHGSCGSSYDCARATQTAGACSQGAGPFSAGSFSTGTVAAGTFSIGFVGRLSPQKGLEYLLKALPLTMDRLQQRYANLSRLLPNQIRTETPASTVGPPPLIKLWVVGDGPEKERLTQMASETTAAREGLAVEFVGAVADVSPWWRCFDIVVLPSLAESFGLVIGEAMATGVPVIASRLPAVEEFVVDGETGLLVPAGDASALASALVRLIADGELRYKLAEQARRYARDHLSATRMAVLTESVYRELLSPGQHPKGRP